LSGSDPDPSSRILPLAGSRPAGVSEQERSWLLEEDPRETTEGAPLRRSEADPPPKADRDADRWIEEPSEVERQQEEGARSPALWRRRAARRLRLPTRLDDLKEEGRNPLDIPTFLRKQMD
jgi:hypothetical protein